MTPVNRESAFILLHPDDNILVCRRSVGAGEHVDIEGHAVALTNAVELGHKIARYDLRAGDKVLRYGCPIGSMTQSVSMGGHVHGHNLASDYIPSHGRDAVHIDGSAA